MDLLILANAADDVAAMETVSDVGSPEEYDRVAGDSLDFDSWTSLITKIEKTCSDNIKAISSVYESFLSWFPLCHEYWKRYADHMARLCTVEKAVEVFEEAVQSATYSVGLWVDYCSFSMLAFTDPSDVRRIFERGLSYVGKDFLCHRLWDLYIRFELSQQQWSFLAYILIRALKFPTKSLHKYYDNFKEFADFVEEDMSCAKSCNLEPHTADSNIEVAVLDDEIYHTIRELQESSSVELRAKALHRFIAIGEQFYQKSCQLHEEIDYFENYMDNDFFSVKPLDDEELQNWHNYLDFIEKQKDFDWAVKLYERCLIPCANYPEFWMRYVEFMESKGGRELASFALERATQVFLKNVSEVHIFNARFRERIGDIEGARAAFHLCDTESDTSIIETAIKEANMETRLGNTDTALEIYNKALKVATEKERMHIIPILYIHFFRLKFMITGRADAAIDLLIAGIQQVPYSRLLLEELINFAMMHEGSKHLDVLDSIIATVITCESDESQGLSSRDREDLSHLYLKFVDYCGTTQEITKAWTRHIKHFPRLIRSTSPHNYLSSKLQEPREKIPRIVTKQPSRVHVKHTEQNSVNAKPQKATTNQRVGNDDDTSEGNAAGELEILKHQSRTEPEEEEEEEEEEEHGHEVETCVKPVSMESLSLCTQEKEPVDLTQKSPTGHKDTVTPYTTNQKQQDTTNERESEIYPPQIPSRNVEIYKTNHMLTTSERVSPETTANIASTGQVPNQDHRNKPYVSQNVQSMVQYRVQSSEQPGLNQNPQAYNQMLQYQYQQQHQNQQQLLQMQQSCQQLYMTQQQPQPQQQRQQQQQQQQQYVTQPQNYQIQQQHEQYQQYWLQMYQQQQQQQQMQEYMKMQQYQQIQQQQQQLLPQDLHKNHQITVLANQIWNNSHDQQGQVTIASHTAIPYTQPNTGNIVVQQMAAPLPANIASSSIRQQPSNSKSLCSPSFERTLET